MLIAHLTNSIRRILNEIWGQCVAWSDPEVFVHHDVPYYGQWESPDLIADILAKKILAADDPRWRNSGALSTEEYAYWSWNCCGMACLKMLLEHHRIVKIPLVTLAKKCLKYGGYQEPLETSPGLFYQPFCHFVLKEFGLSAHTSSALTFSMIVHCLAHGGYVIASVNPAIRTPDISNSYHKGGHLVLIIGYDKKLKTLIFHNPSGSDVGSQKNVQLPYSQFEQFFAYKGILLQV